MKNICKKLSKILKLLFGYGVMITLFLGGMTFFGYVLALILGGSAAVVICDVLYNQIIPVLVYVTSCLVVLGLVAMYLAGEKALVSKKK